MLTSNAAPTRGKTMNLNTETSTLAVLTDHADGYISSVFSDGATKYTCIIHGANGVDYHVHAYTPRQLLRVRNEIRQAIDEGATIPSSPINTTVHLANMKPMTGTTLRPIVSYYVDRGKRY